MLFDLKSQKNPCAQCPWRRENQGKRHPHGFYTKRNLLRLWNGLRTGKKPQSCHLTDPNHPDHIAVGCKPDSKPVECIGSVALLARELEHLGTLAPGDVIEPEHVDRYLAESKSRRGLTKAGLMYLLIERNLIGPAIPHPGEWLKSPDLTRPDEPDQ